MQKFFFSEVCDSYRIQTYNLLIRSQMLYSVELRSLYFWFASAKVWSFSETTKHFAYFFEKNFIFLCLIVYLFGQLCNMERMYGFWIAKRGVDRNIEKALC